MDTNSDTGSPATDLAQAFEALRGEVSLTRAAVEGLTAARERIPDYSPTLAKLGKQIEITIAQTEAIRQAPAITLTRDGIAKRMVEASVLVRAEDARLLHETRDVLSRSIGKIDGIVERGQAADRQWRDRLRYAAGGMIAGILLWSVLPGAIARSLPASWHVPEWMAARTMGMTPHEAGRALSRSDPAAEKSRWSGGANFYHMIALSACHPDTHEPGCPEHRAGARKQKLVRVKPITFGSGS